MKIYSLTPLKFLGRAEQKSQRVEIRGSGGASQKQSECNPLSIV